VHTANGAGMNISNIGYATLHTPNRKLYLKNVLHVPKSHKSLALVHRITLDNNVFLEFHPNLFLIKDRATKTTLHQGRCEGGLYPLGLRQGSSSRSKQVFGVCKPSTSRWHSRLGHPAFPIVTRVIRDNKLPFIDDSSSKPVCDSCQKAKSHQLPYFVSNKVSAALLELIHSDVWGPAPTSVGRFSYYVSFIDDHTKYTWIYLLRLMSLPSFVTFKLL
jgi:histone deacetylase 1/2